MSFVLKLQQLVLIGGKNVGAITHRILATLISDGLARKLSYTGGGQKSETGFKGTSILRLVECRLTV